MPEPLHDRRKAARTNVETSLDIRFGRSVPVRVVELSACGALLWTEEDIAVGTAGRLSLPLRGIPFTSNAVITRKQIDSGTNGHFLGTALGPQRPREQRVLEQFLGRHEP